MSTPNLGPSDPVQIAANTLARARQYGETFEFAESEYPDIFTPLSAQQRREARGLARQAVTFANEIGRAEPDTPFGQYAIEDQPGGSRGMFEIAVPFGLRNAEEKYDTYRTVLIAYTPGQTRESILADAFAMSWRQSPPVGEEANDEDFILIFTPFDLGRPASE